MVSEDCFSPALLNIKNNTLTADPFGASLLDDDIDWENCFCSAPSELGFMKNNHCTSTPPKTVKLKTAAEGPKQFPLNLLLRFLCM